MVAPGLRRRIRAVRLVLQVLREELSAVGMVMSRRCLRGERRLDALRVCQLQSTVDLVCRDMIEQLSVPSLRLPYSPGCLKKGQGTHDVRPGKRERVQDAPVHMALRCQVDDPVYPVVPDYVPDLIIVADVSLDERVVRL